MDGKTADRAVAYYRERFRENGIYENQLYAYIPGLLQDLKSAGATLVVATSKLTVFSEEILRYLEIDGFFSQIVGSNLDGTRSGKADVIAHAMDFYPQIGRDKFVMIGDRKYDMAGASTNGVDAVGVTYGYGSREELLAENPIALADSVFELGEILLHRD